jgi:PBP1b-binding outer membrane lipoprotein LpoB
MVTTAAMVWSGTVVDTTVDTPEPNTTSVDRQDFMTRRNFFHFLVWLQLK